MTAGWYLARRGTSGDPASPTKAKGKGVGPLSVARLLELASSGGVDAGDWVWLENTDVQLTVAQFQKMARDGKLPGSEAGARVDTPASPATSPGEAFLPGWLEDVSQAEASLLSRPRPLPEYPLPDWMQDLRQRKIPPTSLPKDIPLLRDSFPPSSGPSAPVPPLAEIPLDWLEDIRQIEESLRRPPPRKDVPAATAEALSPAPPAPLPVSPSPTPPPAVSPEQSGYNPETGQIVDPAAYALWQKAEAQRRQEEREKQPTLPVAEAFLEAQRALQAWVDHDANKPLVIRGDLDTIRQCPALQELLKRYLCYGRVMQEKLNKHLALLVENRQKFFQAFG
jgi:hypothetical protein